MSQAVIDFCEGLKTTLLGLEDNLAKAKASIGAGATQAQTEARKHVEAATQQLETFKAHASVMAQALRADLPDRTAAARDKLSEYGAEAQTAMRHAVAFLAEGAASALQVGAEKAQTLAEQMKHGLAVATVETPGDEPPPQS